jgi:hypothetical protein
MLILAIILYIAGALVTILCDYWEDVPDRGAHPICYLGVLMMFIAIALMIVDIQ